VHFRKTSHRRRFWVSSYFDSISAQGVLAVVALVGLAFAGGCAGSVTTSSGAFSVSGSITPAADGNGATVALSGPIAGSTTAGSNGSYSFGGLVNGDYTVTPSRTGYTFTPLVQTVTINGSTATGVNFTASPQANQSVLLHWQASTSSVSGYNVYRGTTNGGPYSRVNGSLVSGLSYTDSSLAASTTYYYVTTAVNSAGVESVYSNQASAKIP
jgi:hypothetical protein